MSPIPKKTKDEKRKRSSILKIRDWPTEEDETQFLNSSAKKRRNSRRVSFATTHCVKEFPDGVLSSSKDNIVEEPAKKEPTTFALNALQNVSIHNSSARIALQEKQVRPTIECKMSISESMDDNKENEDKHLYNASIANSTNLDVVDMEETMCCRTGESTPDKFLTTDSKFRAVPVQSNRYLVKEQPNIHGDIIFEDDPIDETCFGMQANETTGDMIEICIVEDNDTRNQNLLSHFAPDAIVSKPSLGGAEQDQNNGQIASIPVEKPMPAVDKRDHELHYRSPMKKCQKFECTKGVGDPSVNVVQPSCRNFENDFADAIEGTADEQRGTFPSIPKENYPVSYATNIDNGLKPSVEERQKFVDASEDSANLKNNAYNELANDFTEAFPGSNSKFDKSLFLDDNTIMFSPNFCSTKVLTEAEILDFHNLKNNKSVTAGSKNLTSMKLEFVEDPKCVAEKDDGNGIETCPVSSSSGQGIETIKSLIRQSYPVDSDALAGNIDIVPVNAEVDGNSKYVVKKGGRNEIEVHPISSGSVLEIESKESLIHQPYPVRCNVTPETNDLATLKAGFDGNSEHVKNFGGNEIGAQPMPSGSMPRPFESTVSHILKPFDHDSSRKIGGQPNFASFKIETEPKKYLHQPNPAGTKLSWISQSMDQSNAACNVENGTEAFAKEAGPEISMLEGTNSSPTRDNQLSHSCKEISSNNIADMKSADEQNRPLSNFNNDRSYLKQTTDLHNMPRFLSANNLFNSHLDQMSAEAKVGKILPSDPEKMASFKDYKKTSPLNKMPERNKSGLAFLPKTKSFCESSPEAGAGNATEQTLAVTEISHVDDDLRLPSVKHIAPCTTNHASDADKDYLDPVDFESVSNPCKSRNSPTKEMMAATNECFEQRSSNHLQLKADLNVSRHQIAEEIPNCNVPKSSVSLKTKSLHANRSQIDVEHTVGENLASVNISSVDNGNLKKDYKPSKASVTSSVSNVNKDDFNHPGALENNISPTERISTYTTKRLQEKLDIFNLVPGKVNYVQSSADLGMFKNSTNIEHLPFGNTQNRHLLGDETVPNSNEENFCYESLHQMQQVCDPIIPNVEPLQRSTVSHQLDESIDNVRDNMSVYSFNSIAIDDQNFKPFQDLKREDLEQLKDMSIPNMSLPQSDNDLSEMSEPSIQIENMDVFPVRPNLMCDEAADPIDYESDAESSEFRELKHSSEGTDLSNGEIETGLKNDLDELRAELHTLDKLRGQLKTLKTAIKDARSKKQALAAHANEINEQRIQHHNYLLEEYNNIEKENRDLDKQIQASIERRKELAKTVEWSLKWHNSNSAFYTFFNGCFAMHITEYDYASLVVKSLEFKFPARNESSTGLKSPIDFFRVIFDEEDFKNKYVGKSLIELLQNLNLIAINSKLLARELNYISWTNPMDRFTDPKRLSVQFFSYHNHTRFTLTFHVDLKSYPECRPRVSFHNEIGNKTEAEIMDILSSVETGVFFFKRCFTTVDKIISKRKENTE